jgi:NDP-sugar pyrophosphorylase family protein
MKAGIIAAGRGERLGAQTNQLKPLVQLGNRTLIEHVLISIATTKVSEVAIIINEASLAVRDQVEKSRWPFALRWIVETTPSSMHSFLSVIETLASDGDGGPFLVSTVDTVTGAETYAQFVAEARREKDSAVTLALTSPGNDEKPLLVRLARNSSRITAIGDAAAPSELATAGLYFVNASILRESESARRDGIDALRAFLARLLEGGYHLTGVPISKSIDVDHPGDIRIAEDFLRTLET